MTEGDPFKEELKGIRRERGKVTLAHRMLFGTDCDGAAPKDQSAVGLAVACMVNARLRAGTGSGSNLSRGTTTCGACPSCRLALGMARIQYSSSEQLQKDQVHHDQYFPSPISMNVATWLLKRERLKLTRATSVRTSRRIGCHLGGDAFSSAATTTTHVHFAEAVDQEAEADGRDQDQSRETDFLFRVHDDRSAIQSARIQVL
jgi:hypothetical protein